MSSSPSLRLKRLIINLDDVAVTIGVAGVDMLGQLRLGQNPARFQHEVLEQSEFGSGQGDIVTVYGVQTLALLVENESVQFQIGALP